MGQTAHDITINNHQTYVFFKLAVVYDADLTISNCEILIV